MGILQKLFGKPQPRVVGKKGRGPVRDLTKEGVHPVTAYLTEALSPGPASVSVPNNRWAMLGNGPDSSVTNQGPNFEGVGDCTLAGWVHQSHGVALKNRESGFKYPSANVIVTQYFSMTPNHQDTGLVEANVLNYGMKTGLFGYKAEGFAPYDITNFDLLNSIIWEFGGAYLGVNIPAPAEQQFANGQPWDLTGTSADDQLEDGHCIPVLGYDANYYYVITWAAVQAVTKRWFQKYLEEGYAVIYDQNPKVNLPVLQADLAQIKAA